MYSDQQLQELKKAYASGLTKIRLSSGDELSYRSLEEMERVIRNIEQQLNPAPKPRRMGYVMRVNKGL
ncbi:phage head-tail joining protein [Alishewanella sp. SMS8]|uniref:phage head-tail joining protein n=1 Tax=unclassified Alishewanella TaxID=2628974 RepID=UPI0027419831|nr:hypothetical protein [Alishewanella sp. SMS8]MDP5205801.1 hypothetical protein [Alishewanella sp. SMS9]MDP5459881.1 hypothetical protein [Alishewanella sp. SMS8]